MTEGDTEQKISKRSIKSPFGMRLPTINRFSVAVIKAINAKHGDEFAKDSPLHTAIRIGNIPLLLKLLEQPEYRACVDVRGDYGETPLHLASALDNLQAVKILLKCGADLRVRRRCFHELNAVHVAAADGSENVLQYFLSEFPASSGCDLQALVEFRDTEGSTPLHWAVQCRRFKCIAQLLEHNAPVDKPQTTSFQATPVHLACYQGLLTVMEIMKEKQPEAFLRALAMGDDEGLKVIHRAALINSSVMIKFLIKNGADPNATDSQGRTAVTLASSTEAWAALRALVEHGANPFLPDPNGRTSLHASAIFGTLPAQADTFNEEFRADLREAIDMPDNFGCTALHYAAIYGNVEAFERLVKMGADVYIKTHALKTILHFAAECGSCTLIKKLFEREDVSVMINDLDKDGLTPICYAANNGSHEVVQLLLSKGALIFRESNGQTPLHKAAAQGYTDVCATILRQYPKIIDYADVEGDTALHLASLKNHPSTTSCLLAHGAILTVNRKGRTPLDLSIAEKQHCVTAAFINDVRWHTFLTTPSFVYGSVSLGLVRHAPHLMKIVLDRCIQPSVAESALDCEFHITYDFSVLEGIEIQKLGKRHHEPPKLLKEISRLNRSVLITHPLTRALLEQKWKMYGMYFHTSFTIMYCVFLSLLTYMVVQGVFVDLIPHLIRQSYDNMLMYKPDLVPKAGFSRLLNGTINGRYFGKIDHFKDYACVAFILVFLSMLLIKESMEFFTKGYRYFLDIVNYLELSMCSCCIAYITLYLMQCDPDKVHDITPWPVGSLTIFLAWFNLLRYFQPYGGVGIYAVMFFAVLKTLMLVSLFFFILTAAFTVTFFELMPVLIFPNSSQFYDVQQDDDLQAKNLLTSHITLYTSALRIGAMTIGDVDTIQNYIQPMLMGKLPFPAMTFVVLVVFFLMMPILLQNLLTGLAVGDISATLSNASCLRLQNQIDLHLLIERLLPDKYELFFRKHLQTYRFYPNLGVSWWEQITRALAGGTKRQVIVGTIDEIDEDFTGKLQKVEFKKLKNEVTRLCDVIDRQQHVLSNLLETVTRAQCANSMTHPSDRDNPTTNPKESSDDTASVPSNTSFYISPNPPVCVNEMNKKLSSENLESFL
ncbi:transient receptor potential cation channel subfamily A member 1-like [Paramacrobiotus metropolitanus]|uniref:transient receptor potential cation channel subfamily A member 1-like n=1 Tax=Paramacrobiotus metropolitanus TaxID=2943436 RepID=UPI002445ED05|nr:transient receptor potential cation channel subfamily A member 1-like [Paramacrobiotus metropolitanus]